MRFTIATPDEWLVLDIMSLQLSGEWCIIGDLSFMHAFSTFATVVLRMRAGNTNTQRREATIHCTSQDISGPEVRARDETSGFLFGAWITLGSKAMQDFRNTMVTMGSFSDFATRSVSARRTEDSTASGTMNYRCPTSHLYPAIASKSMCAPPARLQSHRAVPMHHRRQRLVR